MPHPSGLGIVEGSSENRRSRLRNHAQLPTLPMLLYCIRHGESCYNAEGRIQGQSDVPLSELGLRQSEAVAAALAEEAIEAVHASPLQRAMQTAEPVAQKLGLQIQTDPKLMEVHAGAFQDKLRVDLEEQYPEEMARWRSGDPDFPLPGGETRRQLMQRGYF